jgi:hypothetical protein
MFDEQGQLINGTPRPKSLGLKSATTSRPAIPVGALFAQAIEDA